jgi:hypothetical protein
VNEFKTQFKEKKKVKSRAVVAHAFNPSTWEAEAGRFLSSRPAWSTGEFQDSQGFTGKPCFEKKKTKNKKQKQKNKPKKQKEHHSLSQLDGVGTCL